MHSYKGQFDQVTGMLLIFGFVIMVIFLQLLWMKGMFETGIYALVVVGVFYVGARLAKIVFDKWSTEDPIYNLEKKW